MIDRIGEIPLPGTTFVTDEDKDIMNKLIIAFVISLSLFIYSRL